MPLGAVVASFTGLEKGQELKSLETAMLALQYRWRNGRKRPKWASSWNI